jgi:hypothetical protein
MLQRPSGLKIGSDQKLLSPGLVRLSGLLVMWSRKTGSVSENSKLLRQQHETVSNPAVS